MMYFSCSRRWRRPLALALLGVAAAACPAYAQEIVQPIPGVTQPITDADRLSDQLRALAANPRSLPALLTAGELSVRLGDEAAALAFFTRAEAVDPRNPRVAAGRARVLVGLERPGEALRLFQQAESWGGDVASFALDRGLAFDLVGEQRRAQRDYRLSLQRTPDDEAMRRLALSLGIAGDGESALALLDPLLRRSDRGAWRARAFIMAMEGKGREAERIAASMMAGGGASGMAPFFERLAAMSPIDRAWAVHLGRLMPTPARMADLRLTPPLPPLPPEPQAAQVQVAAVTPAKPLSARERRQQEREARRQRGRAQAAPVAVVAAPPASPLPAPPSGRVALAAAPAQPIVQPFSPASSRPQPGERVALAAAPPRPMVQPIAPPKAVTTPMAPGTGALPIARAQDPAITVPPTTRALAATPPSTNTPTPVPSFSPSGSGMSGPAPQGREAGVVAPAPVPAGAPMVLATAPSSSTTAPVGSSIALAPLAPSAVAPAAVASPPATAAPLGAGAVQLAPVAPSRGQPSPPPAPAPPARQTLNAGNAVLAAIMSRIDIPGSELGVAPPPAPEPQPAREPTPAPATVTAAPPPAPVKLAATEAARAAPAAGRGGSASDRDAKPKPKAKPEVEAKPDPKAKPQVEAKSDPKAKAAKGKPAKPDPAKADPERVWVQVAGGANAADLPKAWRALAAKAPAAFKGKSAWTTPLRATNRLLAGPFPSMDDAQDFVNTLMKAGLSAFAWQSDAGQKIEKLKP